MDKKRCVERWERMKLAETRKWYESPRWKVEGNGDPDDRDLSQNQADRTIKISKQHHEEIETDPIPPGAH